MRAKLEYTIGLLVGFFILQGCSEGFRDVNDKPIELNKSGINLVFYTENPSEDQYFIKYLINITEYHMPDCLLVILADTIAFESIELNPAVSNVVKKATPSNLKFFNFSTPPVRKYRRLILFSDHMFNVKEYYTFFRKEDVRQLVEKRLGSNIKYAAFRYKLKKGHTFSPSLININGVSRKAEEKATWIFISSECMSCALNNYLKKIKKVEEKLISKDKGTVSILMSYEFNTSESCRMIQSYDLKIPVFVASERLNNLEGDYLSESSGANNIFVIMTEKKTVSSIMGFGDFMSSYGGLEN